MLKNLLFAIAISLFSALMLVGCTANESESESIDTTPQTPPSDEELVIPSEGDVPQGAEPFESFEYSRPDYAALLLQMESFIDKAKNMSVDILALQAEAISVKNAYMSFQTMYNYASVMSMADTTNGFYSSEMNFYSTALPEVEKKYERVLCCAATSDYSNRFAECFGFAAMIKYSGAAYTSEGALALLAEEEELTRQYSAIVNGSNLSSAEITEQTIEIFLRLLETRSKIADELGYSTYTEYIYDTIQTDYSHDDVERLYRHVADYLVPVYTKLASRVLNSNSLNPAAAHPKNKVINLLGAALRNIDSDIGNAYSYMLYCNLFNIDIKKSGRLNQTTTYYLPTFGTPYLYATFDTNLTDYTLLCREFGHFYDYYAVGGGKTSKDLSKVTSQAMELLGLLELKGLLNAKEFKYLSCMEYESMMLRVINNSLYSKFEREVYSIPYHEISKESLIEAMEKALDAIGVNRNRFDEIIDFISPELIYEPFSAQTNITSALVSLEIFFEEIANEGHGLSLFKYLIYRGNDISLTSYIQLVSLNSPFDGDTIKNIADALHYNVMGSHYFVDGPGEDSACAKASHVPSETAISLLKCKQYAL